MPANSHLAVVRPAPMIDTSAPAMPTVESIRTQIGYYARDPLPTEEQLGTALMEVNAALAPSPEGFVERALAIMVAAYPSFKPTPDYLAALVSDAAEYPPDAVFRATRDLRRNSKFPPNHAEVIAALNEAVAERHRIKGDIHKAFRSLEFQAEERRKRDEAKQQELERIAAIEAKLAALGHDAPEPGEFVIAERFLMLDQPGRYRRESFTRWKAAIEVPELWAVIVLKRAAIIVKALHAPLMPSDRADILWTLADDEHQARSRLAALAPTIDLSTVRTAVDEFTPWADQVASLLDIAKIRSPLAASRDAAVPMMEA